MTSSQPSKINPWVFVPLLYFMQAMPVTVVQEVATIFYKDLGILNEPITRWTSLISLPWSLQLLLGPLVDLNSTKRRWLLAGQALCALGLIATAFLLKTPHAFEITLVILGATAVVSALCNIATDGFYLISLAKDQQAKFVGIQSTCYRLGRLFCMGVLVQAAGHLQNNGMDRMGAWVLVLGAGGGIYLLGHLINRVTVPRPPEDVEAPSEPGETQRSVTRTLAIVGLGLGGYFALSALVRLTAHLLWTLVGDRLKGWQLAADGDFFGLLQFPGILAEALQFFVAAAVALACLAVARKRIANTPMGDAFASFVAQPKIVPIFFFILFYRFGEAMVVKMSPLFLKDSIANGGLAIPTEQLGVIKGYFGIAGIVAGGLCGAWVVSKLGLKKAFLPLAIAMHAPNLLYLMLATVKVPLAYVSLPYFGDVPFTLVGVDFVDQFGYGFGFAAYMVFIMFVAQRGRYKTAHYAIGTGAGALCIAIAGIVSGIVQSNFGYPVFFISVIFLSIPGLVTLFFIPLEQAPDAV